MKKLNQWLALSGAALLLLGATQVNAQNQRPNRGDFNPEEMRQRMMDRYREELAVKDDAEWKLIQGRIEKVMDARREVGFGGRPFGFGRRGGAGGAPGGDRADRGDRGGRGGRGFGPEPSAEEEALQKAIESNASADEIKGKLAKLRQSREAKEQVLEKAQADLRKVLSVKQEASAVLMGLLK